MQISPMGACFKGVPLRHFGNDRDRQVALVHRERAKNPLRVMELRRSGNC
jgi:hypothetical protein